MMRRYFAATLIVFFFSYAAYLIITNGGKANTVISFKEISTNFHHKLNILSGKEEIKITDEETKIEKALLEQKAADEAKANKKKDDSTVTDPNPANPADNKDNPAL